MDHVAVDVGQPEVSSGIAERQLFMIQTESMQHRGMQIMHAGGFLFRFETNFICGLRKQCRL